MNNKQIAQQLNLISKLMELHGESSFRARAYSQAAYKIDKLSYAVDKENLETKAIPGIGSSIKEVLSQIVTEEPVIVLEELLAQTPPGLIEMMNIKGLGPKKLRTIWQELEIESMGELAYACEENRLTVLKGFGEKTQSNILNNIRFLEQQKGWYLYADAWAIVQILKSGIEKFSEDWHLVGEMALQNVTIQKIDYIGIKSLASISAELKKLWPEEGIIIDSVTQKLSIHLSQGPALHFHHVDSKLLGLKQIELSSTPEWWDSFTLNFQLPQEAASEEEVWLALNKQAVPYYLRHGSYVESKEKLNHEVPIVEEEDIKGVIHAHSTYSDGQHTIKEMAEYAKALGYEYLVMSDHSQSAFYANGLKADRILQQHEEIDRLNAQLAPFKIFKSIESDILYDGSLDYPDEILSKFDLVIASIHSHLQMTEEKAMERVLKAIEHPFTTILGHPTGRLLLSRPGYPLNMEKIIAHCKKHDVVIEINAHPRRLDLDWSYISATQGSGVLLSINPDAHSMEGISMIKFGVKAAQKGGLRRNQNLSSMSLAAFNTFLKAQKSKH